MLLEQRPGDTGEHWVCNGTSIYEFRHGDRQLRETKLPPELRGKAISDGPLPFVFGAKADTLKKRYFMRLVTPPGVTDQIWLESLPRFQADAANFATRSKRWHYHLTDFGRDLRNHVPLLTAQVNDTTTRATHAIFAQQKSALNFLVFGDTAGLRSVKVVN